MRPRIGITDGIAGIDLENRLERCVVNPQANSLIVRLDCMNAAFVFFLLRNRGISQRTRFHRIRSVCELMEPGTDAGQRSHKTAGAQKPAARASARAQKAVKLFLVYFVTVQQPVGSSFVECGILNVFAEKSGALFFSTTEKVSTSMTVRLSLAMLVFGIVILGMTEIVRHCFLLMKV